MSGSAFNPYTERDAAGPSCTEPHYVRSGQCPGRIWRGRQTFPDPSFTNTDSIGSSSVSSASSRAERIQRVEPSPLVTLACYQSSPGTSHSKVKEALPTHSLFRAYNSATFLRLSAIVVIVLSVFTHTARAFPSKMEHIAQAQAHTQVQIADKSLSSKNFSPSTIAGSSMGTLPPPIGSVRLSYDATDRFTLLRRRDSTRRVSLDESSSRVLLDSDWLGSPGMSRGLDASFKTGNLAQRRLVSSFPTQPHGYHQVGGSGRAQGRYGVDRSRTRSHGQEKRSLEMTLDLIHRRNETANQTSLTGLDKLPRNKNATIGIAGSSSILSPLPPLLAVDPHPAAHLNKTSPHWIYFYGSHAQADGKTEAGVFAVNVDSQVQGMGLGALPGIHDPKAKPVQTALAPVQFFSLEASADGRSAQSFHDWVSGLGHESSAAIPAQQGGTPVVQPSSGGTGGQIPAWGPNPLVNPAFAKGSAADGPVPGSESPFKLSPDTADAAPSASLPSMAPLAEPPVQQPNPLTGNALAPDASATHSVPSSTFISRPSPSRSISSSSATAAPTNTTSPPPPGEGDSQPHPRRHVAAIVLGTFAGAALVVVLGTYAYRQRKDQQRYGADQASTHGGDNEDRDRYTNSSGALAQMWSQRRRREMRDSKPWDLEKGEVSPFDDRFSKRDDLPPLPVKARSIVSTIRAVPRGLGISERRGSLPLLPELEVSPRTRMQELSNLAQPLGQSTGVPAQKRVPVPPIGSLGTRTSTLSSSSGSNDHSGSDYITVAEQPSSRASRASTLLPDAEMSDRPGMERGISSDDRGSVSGQSRVSHISYPFLSAMHRGRSIASAGSPIMSKDDSDILASSSSPTSRSLGTISNKTSRLLRNLRTASSPTMSATSPFLPTMSEVMAQNDRIGSPFSGSSTSGPTASLNSRHEGATSEAMETLRNAVFPIPPPRALDADHLTPLGASSSQPSKHSGGNGVQRTPSLAGIGAGFRYGVARHFVSLLAGPVLAGRDQPTTTSASSNLAQQQQQIRPPATPVTFNSPLFPWDANGAFASPNPNSQTPQPEEKEKARRPRKEDEQDPTPAKRKKPSPLRVTNLE
ncbi:hypothetical protein CF319_g540 [Tilletia indica]|nr:hypothetical protein CF319_g540 [Tilletia indica]